MFIIMMECFSGVVLFLNILMVRLCNDRHGKWLKKCIIDICSCAHKRQRSRVAGHVENDYKTAVEEMDWILFLISMTFVSLASVILLIFLLT